MNGDLSRRVTIDTATMSWQSSPSPAVWRKRLHLVGDTESGQVTSIVRFAANARFSAHGHPGGEEILVLEGKFEDEHGSYPAGTWLRNPSGSVHTPFSKLGALIYVKTGHLN